MKRFAFLVIVVLNLLLCACSKPAPAPAPEEAQITVTDETVQLLSNKKIEAVKEGEPLPFFLVSGEETPIYYEDELRETVQNFYKLQYQADIEYLRAEYKGEPVYKAVSVKKYESPLDNIPVLKDYDISWIKNVKQYDGDFAYEQYLPEGTYTRRTACKVFEEEYPSGVPGAWSVCKETGGDLPIYPFEEALNHLEGQTVMELEAGYVTDKLVKYEDTLFYSVLNSSDTKIPVPDIYMHQVPAPGYSATVENGTIVLSVREGNGAYFLTIMHTDRRGSDMPKYYRSTVCIPK